MWQSLCHDLENNFKKGVAILPFAIEWEGICPQNTTRRIFVCSVIRGDFLKYYMGIDGGGTYTKAVVADEKGVILCNAEGGSINFYSVGMAESRQNLKNIIEQLTAKIGDVHFNSVFIGCSALDDWATEAIISDLCDGIINADIINMNSDVYVAYVASGCDSIAICGTGSMAMGKKCDGQLVVKGGWGHILGDEGSGYSIALNAIKHSCYCADHGYDDTFANALNKYFNVTSTRQIIDVIYSESIKKDFVAGYGAEVGRLADNGDLIALDIIEGEAFKLADTVMSLFDETQNAGTLALYGGVFKNCQAFKGCFCENILFRYPELKIEKLTVSPEQGALNIARGLYE